MSTARVGVQTVAFGDRSPARPLADSTGRGSRRSNSGGGTSRPTATRTGPPRRSALDEAGVAARGYGVVDIGEPGEVERHAAFADRLGAGYLTVNYPPDRDDVTEALVAAAEEFGPDVAIHNHPSVHHDDLSAVCSSIADGRGVLDRYDHPRLGLCLDTGHLLVEDGDPEAVVRELGDRILAVHLKDTSEAEPEDPPGAGGGRLDLPRVVGLLDEYADVPGPVVIEYELPPERAVEALREAETNVRTALADTGSEDENN